MSYGPIDMDRVHANIRAENAIKRDAERERKLSHEPLDGKHPKYHITKADGTPVDPKAKYIVLRIDNKPATSPERAALHAYLDALQRDGQHDLHQHLIAFFAPEVSDAYVQRDETRGGTFP